MNATPRSRLPTLLATAGFVFALVWGAEARRARREYARVHRALVDLLLNTLSAGDAITERHSRRVADLADIVFRAYRFPPDEHATLRLAALLHDMGKIDDRFFHILHSYEALSTEDRERIREHPQESADILQPLEEIHPGISRIVEAHHECWNGHGYPEGLAGAGIPLGARIISVADVFDALTQPRAYHEPLSADDALAQIRMGAGSRFDPDVVSFVTRPEIARQWTAIAARGRAEEAAEAAAV